jgi:rRNA-processing protein FCF1
MTPEVLVAKYKTKGVLIDTNLLVLLTVGIYRRGRIATFKRTRQYTLDDFTLMLGLFNHFDRRLTSPNILTETDNLLRQLPESEHQATARIMAALVARLFEQYQMSTEAVQTASFARLGLTDCVTISLAHDVLVMTDDLRLANELSRLGRDAININHIRTLNS